MNNQELERRCEYFEKSYKMEKKHFDEKLKFLESEIERYYKYHQDFWKPERRPIEELEKSDTLKDKYKHALWSISLQQLTPNDKEWKEIKKIIDETLDLK